MTEPADVPEEEQETATLPDASDRVSDHRLLVATLFTLFAIGVGNTTAGAVAIPAIGDVFDAGPADVGWIVFGYAGAFAIMTAVYGTLAKRFGVAHAIVAGVVLVFVGGTVSMVAVNLPMLITGRVVQGIGAGAVPPLSIALIARRMSGPARSKAIGINIAAVGVGFALGPLTGGLALQTVGWRGAMALGVLTAPAVPILWRLEAKRDEPDRSAPLDPRGTALLAIVVASLVFLVNRTPVLGVSVATLGAAVLAVVFGLTLVHHFLTGTNMAFPREVVTVGRLWRLMVLGFVGQTAFLGTIVVIPIAAVEIHDLDGILLGLVLVPMAVVIVIVSPRNGSIQAAIGRPMTTTLSLTMISGGAILLGLMGADASPVLMGAGLIVAGAGFAVLNAPLANEVTLIHPGTNRSVALGFYNLLFFMGTASGSGLSTALVQAEFQASFFSGRSLPGYSSALIAVASIAFMVGLARLLVAAVRRRA